MTAFPLSHLRRSLLVGLMGLPDFALALSSPQITASVVSPDCLNYRVVGVCYWLFCTNFGCSVRTSPKVRHYVPDAVVSSYANTGENPWRDVRVLSPANTTAQGGGDGTTGISQENDLSRFKNADVIGHPGGWVFSQFAGQSGYARPGAGTAFMPYLPSTLDTLAWRYNIPEVVYPEALTPGRRDVGSRAASVTPTQSATCAVFPNADAQVAAITPGRCGALTAAASAGGRPFSAASISPEDSHEYLASAVAADWPAADCQDGSIRRQKQH